MFDIYLDINNYFLDRTGNRISETEFNQPTVKRVVSFRSP